MRQYSTSTQPLSPQPLTRSGISESTSGVLGITQVMSTVMDNSSSRIVSNSDSTQSENPFAYQQPDVHLSDQGNNSDQLINQVFDSNFDLNQQRTWSVTDSENPFEPLVRQMFGADADFRLEDFEPLGNPNEYAAWGFPQGPLLAEFTSGLEGFL